MRYDFEHLTNPVSEAIIRETIEQQMEDVKTPCAVRNYLLQHEGKPLTKRHAAALSILIGHKVTIRKQFGMTHLEWEQKGADGQPENFSMLMAHAETNVLIPGPDWFVNHCAREISAAVERNDNRYKILNDPKRCQEIASAVQQYRTACHKLRTALDHNADDPTEYADNPDDCTIKRRFIIP